MQRDGHRYHHGDLRAALTTAALELARAGGPEAISIREATRRAGVSPNAAYRHFADRRSLVFAAAEKSQADLALTIEKKMADTDLADGAMQRLRAVGMAYIDFAINEPGWFRLAFTSASDPQSPDTIRPQGNPPFRLLLAALDDLVTAGILTASRRRNADWACWSAVHGFAELVTAGPLQGQPSAAIHELAEYVVDVAIQGVISAPPAPTDDR